MISNPRLAPNPEEAPLLSVRNARKSYGLVTALAGAELSVRRGEIVALLGDNGAGKSTLIKAISGIVVLDEGDVELSGHKLNLRSPGDARAHGIETVFQDLAVFDNLTVAENFSIGRERVSPRWLGPLGFLSTRNDTASWIEHAQQLTVKNVSPQQEIGLMSGGQRQAVAVARAVAFASSVIILDEPTAALGVRESEEILNLVKRLPDRGLGVIIVSHNMDHVVRVAHRAVVMRGGRTVGGMVVTPGIERELVAMIMGAR
ncbi:ATP-binding cassette domain-containing protein [Lichenifustis flavocetrariae]|uniref:ATP-binding cassette domain-containing protein n=1 Tax=Lichenifustis flavocetrariae TaxID=2949735 RepID=A0AA42CS67_9HYPH|nr:ATP-binding cassette domain-containing protein [Lichenifustis flavocetrariae]MCW6513217.1 ATP-binding cassette domain-containing protein [Lichenifustis flavocetrariae]